MAYWSPLRTDEVRGVNLKECPLDGPIVGPGVISETRVSRERQRERVRERESTTSAKGKGNRDVPHEGWRDPGHSLIDEDNEGHN